MKLGLPVAVWLACVGGTAALAAPPPVAVVNGEPIPREEFDAVLAALPPSLTPLSAAQQRMRQQEAVDELIDILLVQQFLRTNAPPVDAAEVGRRLAAFEAAQKAVGKSLADFYKENRLTEAQVRAKVLMGLQLDAYLRSKTPEAELKKYYDANRDYFEKVRVRASDIILRVSPATPPAEREQARQKLLTIRQEIAAGKRTFADAAKAYSQDASAEKGGDLGLFARKWMYDEAFAKVAFSLKVGALSEVVETEFALHLLQVTERTAPVPTSFAQIQDDVRECMAAELRAALVADLRRTAKISVNLP